MLNERRHQGYQDQAGQFGGQVLETKDKLTKKYDDMTNKVGNLENKVREMEERRKQKKWREKKWSIYVSLHI